MAKRTQTTPARQTGSEQRRGEQQVADDANYEEDRARHHGDNRSARNDLMSEVDGVLDEIEEILAAAAAGSAATRSQVAPEL